MNSYEPDTVYFNMRITGDTSNIPSIASYQTLSQTNPVVNDPSKYYVAVTDFSCPGESIPITIARVIPNQNDPNLMQSKIAFTSNVAGVSNKYEQNLIFIPSTTISAPVQNRPYQVITPYYFVYSYQSIITSLNIALIRAYDALAAVIVDFVGLEYPYFYISYDQDFPKIHLMIPKTVLEQMWIPDPPGPTREVKISINSYLVNYLGGFDYTYNGNNDSNLLDFVFNIPAYSDVKNVNPVVNTSYLYYPITCDKIGFADENGDWYKFSQQNYLLPQWNCLSKIIIYTQSLPIRNQQVTSKQTDSPDVLNKYPILFSFTPDYETSSQARNYIYYTPRENYTLTELLTNTPLTRLDAYIAWVDHNGEVFPLYLNPFQSCNIQLGFFKKELYKSSK